MNKKIKVPTSNDLDREIFFEIVVIIILIPTLTFFLITLFRQNGFYGKIYREGKKTLFAQNVKIVTDKKVYDFGEKAVLDIVNNTDRKIYLEPCANMGNFEKKTENKWQLEKTSDFLNIYDRLEFDKKEKSVKCEVDLSGLERGIYRVPVKIYYDCLRPGGSMCGDLSVFYSNEFVVTSSD